MKKIHCTKRYAIVWITYCGHLFLVHAFVKSVRRESILQSMDLVITSYVTIQDGRTLSSVPKLSVKNAIKYLILGIKRTLKLLSIEIV